eukprot:scaffold1888_cov120-Cylindrotheca_fusiformis.AAC.7
MRKPLLGFFLSVSIVPNAVAFQELLKSRSPKSTACQASRRDWLSAASATAASFALLANQSKPASAIGPVKIDLLHPTYSAVPCPRDKPIPGEKAMKGMKGLCVTVDVDLDKSPEKDLEKVGVYGFITDKGTGESVLANNPDLSTDAGQFAIVPEIKSSDKKIQFEFIAAVPREMDTTQYSNGIAPLDFSSLRVVSFPGGLLTAFSPPQQQYGAINPCEMDEFSDECEEWEKENGAYVKGDYMVKSNRRTMGR